MDKGSDSQRLKQRVAPHGARPAERLNASRSAEARQPGDTAVGADPFGPAVLESVRPVLESLLHLLPTAASLHDAEGRLVASEQAAAVCRFLSRPPDSIDLPNLCEEDCEALARRTLASGHRERATCRGGFTLAAVPLTTPGGTAGDLGALVAAVGDAPADTEHWMTVAATFQRPPSKVIEAERLTPRHGLRDWEGEERLEVAASVLSRAITGARTGAAADTLDRTERQPVRRGAARVVLETVRAAAGADSDAQVVRDIARRLREVHSLPAAWSVLLRRADPRGAALLDPPAGVTAATWQPGHPALVTASAGGGAVHHESLAAWPEHEALREAGILSAVVAPIRVLTHLEAVIVLALPADSATLAGPLAVLADDLALVASAHLAGARALAEERRRNVELRALTEVCARTHSSLDVGEVLDAVVDAFLGALDFTRSAVFLLDPATRRVKGVASRGHAGLGRARLIEGPIESFPAALDAQREGRALYVGEDEDRVPVEYKQLFGVAGFVLVPLIAHRELLGFIALDRGGTPFRPAPGELELATTLAQPAALALAHARLHAHRVAAALAASTSEGATLALQGLGLPALAALASHPGVRIDVERRDDGVLVQLKLPNVALDAAAERELQSCPERLRASTSVLVVDDDDEGRTALVGLLKAWGHDAWGAEGGEAALALLVQRRFDLVITDLVMPDIDGWAVARRVHDLSDPPPVVLLTGFPVQAEPAVLAARHVQEIIEKPSSPAILKSVLARHARRHDG